MLPAAPAVPLREALLLLPSLPTEATVLAPLDPWRQALESWGVEARTPGGGAPTLAVGDDGGALAATGCELALLVGHRGRDRLVSAGYQVQRWRTTPTQHGAPALVPVGDDRLLRRLRTGGARRRPRQVAADVARAVQRPAELVVASRRTGLPLALQDLPQGAPRFALLAGEASARRRPVFLLAGSDARWERVVKVNHGPDAASRAAAEQAVLHRLAALGAPGVPSPLGSGAAGSLLWSAETAVAGAPLLDVLRSLPADAGRQVLAAAATHVGDLEQRTRGPLATDAGLRLRGPHVALARLVPAGTPGVLVHGDLPGNVLIDETRISVLDWETARSGGLPLHDLVPLLCLGLAAVRRVPQQEVPDFLLPVLRGQAPDSPWLLDQMRRALRRLGVPLSAGGALVALALGSWASVRLLHDELVLSAGGIPTAWTSPAERLISGWLRHPELGTAWPAISCPD